MAAELGERDSAEGIGWAIVKGMGLAAGFLLVLHLVAALTGVEVEVRTTETARIP